MGGSCRGIVVSQPEGGCPQCGSPGEIDRFRTACGFDGGDAAAQPSTAARNLRRSGLGPRRGARVWLISGLAALLVGAGAGVVLALVGSSDSGRAASVDHSASSPAAAPASGDASAAAASPATATGSLTAVPVAPSPTVIVLAASGSMNYDVAPGPRIDAAKSAVQALVDALPDGSPVGLVVYGTGTDSTDAAKAEGCRDVRTSVPLGPLDRAAFKAQVGGMVASGHTPLGNALRVATAELPAAGPRTVIVLSDGDDTCQPPEPCAVATDLSGADLTIHTVGFRVSPSAKDALTCIAQAGHGRYVDAANATQLQAFLRHAADPNVSVNALTHHGFGDLTIGMTADRARAVDAAIDPVATGTVVVVTVDQGQARIYPRDGALPESGATTPGVPAIGPDGFGVLRLGMSVGQAKQADPSLTVTSSQPGGCTIAETTDAEAVAFNRDGTLSWINPRGGAQTPEGLTIGETADRAFDLYLIGEPYEVSINYGANWFPVARGSKVHYLLELRGPGDAESSYPARLATITGINLDGGQECFG